MTQTLTWPLRISNGRLATAQQDTEPDITSCVGSILRTPHGWRLDSPDFGRPPGVQFAMDGVDLDTLTAAITEQEPRATPDLVRDELATQTDRIRVDQGGLA